MSVSLAAAATTIESSPTTKKIVHQHVIYGQTLHSINKQTSKQLDAFLNSSERFFYDFTAFFFISSNTIHDFFFMHQWTCIKWVMVFLLFIMKLKFPGLLRFDEASLTSRMKLFEIASRRVNRKLKICIRTTKNDPEENCRVEMIKLNYFIMKMIVGAPSLSLAFCCRLRWWRFNCRGIICMRLNVENYWLKWKNWYVW